LFGDIGEVGQITMTHKPKGSALLGQLAVATLLLGVALPAQADSRQDVIDSIPKPASSGQVAQVGAAAGELFSIFGPSISIGDAPTLDVSDLVMVEAPLAELIRAKSLPVIRQVTFAPATGLAWTDTLQSSLTQQLQLKPLNAEVLATNTLAIQAHCKASNQACFIRYTGSPQALRVEIAPVTIKQVLIEDGKHFKARSVKTQLGLKAETPISPRQLEARVQQIMDNPDIRVSAKLEPVELDPQYPNAVRVSLKIADDRPQHVAGYWSNLDQFDYGEYFSSVGMVHNNVTGLGDTASLFPIIDRHAVGGIVHYEVPINQYGTRFKIDSTIVRTQAKTEQFRANRLLGKGWTLGVGFSHPLIRRPNWRLTADATTDIMQVRTIARQTELGSLEVEQENLRDIRVGLQFDHTGDYGSTSFRNEITQGLDIFGATPNSSKKLTASGAGSQYTRYIGTFSFQKNLPHGMTALLNAQGQYSPNKLPVFQQYGAGGTFTGRGYKEVLIPGDTALFTSVQLNMPAGFIPKGWVYPFSKGTSVRDSLEFLIFTDYAWAKLNDKTAATDPTEHFLSTGIGARIKINKTITARIDLGVPILRNPPFNQNLRVHFGLIGAMF
jgi:hemolysin activation/secretion protein